MTEEKSEARKRLEAYVAEESQRLNTFPIYEIVLFTRPGTEYDKLGWPDTGISDHPGFYYELDTTIRALNENWGGMDERCFSAGLILPKFPGTYSLCHASERMYFLWDEKRGGFFEAEEPAALEHSLF